MMNIAEEKIPMQNVDFGYQVMCLHYLFRNKHSPCGDRFDCQGDINCPFYAPVELRAVDEFVAIKGFNTRELKKKMIQEGRE